MSKSIMLTGMLGSASNNDYYEFELTQTTSISYELAGYQLSTSEGLPNLELLNATGQSIYTLIPDGTVNLAAGTYYLYVSDSNNITYSLDITATPITVYGGPSTSSARNLGTLTASGVSFSDWVGSANLNDYYEFTVGTSNQINIALTGVAQEQNLYLLNADGQGIASTGASPTSNGSIVENLAAGNYYVEVVNAT